jgi:hypothetical protein
MRTANAPGVTELRAVRERVRGEYLAVARTHPHDTAECDRLWREFLRANAAYLRARGRTR